MTSPWREVKDMVRALPSTHHKGRGPHILSGECVRMVMARIEALRANGGPWNRGPTHVLKGLVRAGLIPFPFR